jgi:raffinose/stachyose/melibiose transport system substrate-binding protein
MKVLRAGAALVLAVTLAACGGTGSTGTTNPADVVGEIEPRPISWLLSRPADGDVISTVEEIADAYAKEHPGFSLELITTPDRPSYLQKLETLAAANRLPELFDTDATPFAAKLKDQGRMVDVEALLRETGRYDAYRPLALDYQRFDDGSLHLLPFEFEIEVFWYNTALFEQAGLTPPRTLDEMVGLCGPLRERGVVPIALGGADRWPLQRFMAYYPFRLAGPDYVKGLRTGSASLSDAPGAAGVNWIYELGRAGCFAEGFSSAGYTDARDLFTSGRAAVYNIGTWELPTLSAPDLPIAGSLDYFTLPTTDNAVTADNEYVTVSGIGTALNAATFDPLVKDFVTYLLERYPAMYAAKGRFSPTTDVEVTKPDGATAIFDEAVAELGDLGSAVAVPWDTQLDPASNARMQQELTLLAQGDVTPDQFISTVDATIAENAPRYFGG